MVLIINILFHLLFALQWFFRFYWNSSQAYVLYSGYQIIERTCDIHERLKIPCPTPYPSQSHRSFKGHWKNGLLVIDTAEWT